MLASSIVYLFTSRDKHPCNSQSHFFITIWLFWVVHELTIAVNLPLSTSARWIALKYLFHFPTHIVQLFLQNWCLGPFVLVFQEKRNKLCCLCTALFSPYLLFNSSLHPIQTQAVNAIHQWLQVVLKQIFFSLPRKRKLKMFTVLLMCYTRWLSVMHCVAAYYRMCLQTAHLNSVSPRIKLILV